MLVAFFILEIWCFKMVVLLLRNPVYTQNKPKFQICSQLYFGGKRYELHMICCIPLLYNWFYFLRCSYLSEVLDTFCNIEMPLTDRPNLKEVKLKNRFFFLLLKTCPKVVFHIIKWITEQNCLFIFHFCSA